MLRPDGLTEDELDEYHAAISVTHRRQIEVEVTTLNGKTVAHLTPEVVDGSVLVDSEAADETPSRILDMTFVNPGRALWEPNSATDVPLHRQYAVQVVDSRYVAELNRWVECEVFTGPLWDFDRDGALVQVVGHGWERQCYAVKWNPESFRKGTRKTDVLKELFEECGFTNLGGIPDLRASLPERLTVTKRDQLWPAMRKIAKSMDRHLFFDATGRPRLERLPDAVAFTFDERHLMAAPVLDRQAEGSPNTFEVIGSKPAGAKRRPRDIRELDPDHPNSKESLAKGGKTHRVLVTEENRAIKTQAEAEARAKRLRENAERGVTDVQLDLLPFPHLEELDLIAVADEVGLERVRVKRFTLPLAGGPVTVNALGRGRWSGKDLGRGKGKGAA